MISKEMFEALTTQSYLDPLPEEERQHLSSLRPNAIGVGTTSKTNSDGYRHKKSMRINQYMEQCQKEGVEPEKISA